MNIFGFQITKRAEEKKGKIYNGGTLGTFGSLPDSTFDLFFKYYRKSSDLHRCVQEIMGTVGKGGLTFIKGEEVIEDKVLNSYLNNTTKFVHLKNNIIRDVSVTGNCFLFKQKNLNGKPLGLQTLDPRTMSIVVNEYGEVQKYIQTVSGKSIPFTPDEIYHAYQEKDPDNEIFGLSTMEGVITDVLADYESSLTNYYYFKNNAVPSQLIILEEGMSEEEKANAMELLQKNFSGGKNKHKIGAVSGIKDIKQVQNSIADMEFTVLRHFTTERVCAAWGVPKTILGYTDGVNYTNAETQYSRFIENTILPREERIEGWINEIISERTDTRIKFDSDHIDDFGNKIDIIVKQIQYGLITPNEARQELGYEDYTMPEGDMPLISRSLSLLSDVGLSDTPNLNGGF